MEIYNAGVLSSLYKLFEQMIMGVESVKRGGGQNKKKKDEKNDSLFRVYFHQTNSMN